MSRLIKTGKLFNQPRQTMQKPLPLPNIKLDKLFILVAALLLFAAPAKSQSFKPNSQATIVTNGVVLWNFWGPDLTIPPGPNGAANGLPACEQAIKNEINTNILGAPTMTFYSNNIEGQVNLGLLDYIQEWV